MFNVGEIVKFSPKFSSPGEEYYIHEVRESDQGRYIIVTLNSLLTLAPSERVDEEMIQKASKYEVILNRNWKDRGYIVTDTEERKFFAGYDFMGSVNWVDSDSEATAMDAEEAQQIAKDLEAAEA